MCYNVYMKMIENDINNNELKQTYLLYGEERYLIRQYKDKLKKAIMGDGDSMNLSEFEGKDIEQKEIIDIAETMPFFAERRLIIIEDGGFFGTDKSKSNGPLVEYMDNIPESTYFIFVEESIDKRSKLYKNINKNGRCTEFAQQSDELLSKWIAKRIKTEGKGMTQAAYNLFISKTGSDMENIDKELEKLLCYCLDKKTIEVSDVMCVTTEQIQSKIFDMVDAICLHKQKQALDLYYDLLALKEPAMKIMFLISRQFEILLKVKLMVNQGYGNKEIASKVGCPEWSVRKYQTQAKEYTVKKLKEIINTGVEYEQMCKTGMMNDTMVVEIFIVQYSKK